MAASRTLTTGKGRSVTTTLTNEQAVAKCAALDSQFAQKLARLANSPRGLSADQIAWIHILANDAKPESVSIGSVSGILDIMLKAKAHLSFPKIRLQTASGQKVVLLLSGDRSKFAGHVAVTDGGKFGENKYFGRISPEGEFVSGSATTEGLIELLTGLAANPAQVAAAYGKVTGTCCFCGKALEDARSVSMGYGPTCAVHYSLPWGDKPSEKVEKVKGGAVKTFTKVPEKALGNSAFVPDAAPDGEFARGVGAVLTCLRARGLSEEVILNITKEVLAGL